jgi:signal transduction histidine kinase
MSTAMSSAIGIFCCNNFHREVSAAVAAEGWRDVTVIDFPARCGRPPLAWDEIRALLPAECGHIFVMGRACLGSLSDAPAGFPPVRMLRQKQCFHLVADPSLVDQAIVDGAYLLTPAWLADWPRRIEELGFQPDTAGEFFRDFASRLVLLDTGIEPDSVRRLDELAKAVGLPAKRVDVGLEHIRLILAKAVLEVRLEEESKARQTDAQSHRRELADHVAAMDLLARLAGTQNEDESLAAVEDVFRMLFAPAFLHCLRVEHGQAEARTGVPDETRAALAALQGTWAWTPSGQGFLLRIGRETETLALFAVDGLAFPEFRERYLNLALAMSGVCALTIDNARTHKRLVEAEKMASLGVLVAGVAHEINTPLGIGLAAASTLQKQSAAIAQSFTARQMTQSSLQGYLSAASDESALIRSNLERIARLIDSFRQLAVSGHSPARQTLRFRSALENIVAGLREQLSEAGVELQLECDPALETRSFLDDWVTIFSNLLKNSLRHGFHGRGHGSISIAVAASESGLRIDYRDDGAGMEAEVRRRVFDPFFTTAMQDGMGLGMHLVYNLVTQHLGGSIRCASEPGQGCHFHIEVPR